jgi:predicted lipoprotein with Yx(FWY)xxD motif
MNRTIYALCLLVTLALALAGCGGGDDGPGEVTYGPTAAEEKAAEEEAAAPEKRRIRASVWRAESEDIKRGIFEFDGFTLYRFDKDQESKPSCYGACAKKWPPLITELKPYGVDVVKSKVGTTRRKDGTLQVTYFGYPLYTYVGDKVTGEVNGHGVEAFGGTWYALRANGQDKQ